MLDVGVVGTKRAYWGVVGTKREKEDEKINEAFCLTLDFILSIPASFLSFCEVTTALALRYRYDHHHTLQPRPGPLLRQQP